MGVPLPAEHPPEPQDTQIGCSECPDTEPRDARASMSFPDKAGTRPRLLQTTWLGRGRAPRWEAAGAISTPETLPECLTLPTMGTGETHLISKGHRTSPDSQLVGLWFILFLFSD